MKLVWSLLLLLVAGHCHAIDNRELYDVVAQGSVTLKRGNEESTLVRLHAPIHFYSEKYDSINVSFQSVSFFDVNHPSSRAWLKKLVDIFRHRKEGARVIRAEHHIIPSCFVAGARHHLKTFISFFSCGR